MEESPLLHLDLRAPLRYAETPGLDPFSCPVPGASDELLFCFELDPEQAAGIEPDPACFPGKLLFAGREDGERGEKTLPAGQYLFIQRREALRREEIIDMAVEQQKDGLWERLRLENRLYIRRLFEDNSQVTQLFRPYLQGG